MKKAIIFGVSCYSKHIFYYLNQENKIKVCGFTVDLKHKTCDSFMGLPVIDFENIEEHFPPSEYGIFICIGYKKMNAVREAKFFEAESKGYEILSYCHPSAIINCEEIGKGNIIMENVVIQPYCKVGSGNIICENTVISHEVQIGNFNHFGASVAVAGGAKIENNCFIGGNSSIKEKICLEDKTLVGSGAYISKSTKANSAFFPAKTVKIKEMTSEMVSEIFL